MRIGCRLITINTAIGDIQHEQNQNHGDKKVNRLNSLYHRCIIYKLTKVQIWDRKNLFFLKFVIIQILYYHCGEISKKLFSFFIGFHKFFLQINSIPDCIIKHKLLRQFAQKISSSLKVKFKISHFLSVNYTFCYNFPTHIISN